MTTPILDWFREHLNFVENEDEDSEPVDVDELLVAKYQEHKESGGRDLNYKTSVKDLMELLGLNSTFEARVALAKQFGYTGPTTTDSGAMNKWLYNEIKCELVEHGGTWQ